jgi:hypothetical protein
MGVGVGVGPGEQLHAALGWAAPLHRRGAQVQDRLLRQPLQRAVAVAQVLAQHLLLGRPQRRGCRC